MTREMGSNFPFVERLNDKCEVIEITGFLARAPSPKSTECPVDCDQVDQCAARPELTKSKFDNLSLNDTTEYP
jgi:hypothetical protein